jgi:hypothetical protein
MRGRMGATLALHGLQPLVKPAVRTHGRPLRSRTSTVGAKRATSSIDSGLRHWIVTRTWFAGKSVASISRSVVPHMDMIRSRIASTFRTVIRLQRSTGTGPVRS